MRQEADPAMATADRTVFQIRMIAQDDIKRQLILTNKRPSAIVLMPIVVERENFGQRYDKNARFSVRMLIGLCISSSYELDVKTSRSRARLFCARHEKGSNQLAQTISPHTIGQPQLPTQPVQLRSQPNLGRYLERKSIAHGCMQIPILLFQVVGPFSRAAPGQFC
jgi:hypothetical protein